MNMHELKRKRDKVLRKIKRRRKWRQRTIKLQKMVGKKIGKRLDGLLDALGHQLKALNRELKDTEKAIQDLAEAREKGRQDFIKFLNSVIGMTEDSSQWHKMAAELGVDPDWAWCSSLVEYGLWKFGGFKKEELPSNFPYSGSWLTWALGERISYAQRQPGDLLIFDWGDGNMTDHVATYTGDGIKIGGNENDRVEKDAVPVGAIVGVVRPRWNH